MRRRNQTLRKKAFKRDNFTCRKCGLKDKECEFLEAHHMIQLYADGLDNLDNLITLCSDCHRYAPDKKEEFEEYMKEECEGTMTTLIKVFKQVRNEYPELFKEIEKKKN